MTTLQHAPTLTLRFPICTAVGKGESLQSEGGWGILPHFTKTGTVPALSHRVQITSLLMDSCSELPIHLIEL